jgi:hypothetical protein
MIPQYLKDLYSTNGELQFSRALRITLASSSKFLITRYTSPLSFLPHMLYLTSHESSAGRGTYIVLKPTLAAAMRSNLYAATIAIL